MKMEKGQTGAQGEGAYGDFDATGDAGSSAKAKNESGSVEGPRKNIQSENKQESSLLIKAANEVSSPSLDMIDNIIGFIKKNLQEGAGPLTALREQMKNLNKEWEKTFNKNEKQRLKQEIIGKEKQIKKEKKKASKKDNEEVPATTSVCTSQMPAVDTAIIPPTCTSSATINQKTGNGLYTSASTLPDTTMSKNVTLLYSREPVQNNQNDQLYNPKRRASFNKFGSEPNQIENLLISKVKCFSSDEPNIKVIKHVVKHTILRENTTGQGKLDKRRSANTRLFEKSLIPSKFDSPNKLVADTLNERGVTRFDNYLKQDYHEAQGILFQSLKALDLFALPEDIRVEGGYLKRDATTIPTAEFCDVVDDVTERFMKRYSSDLIPIENIHMQAVYESCERICIKRLLMDMAIQNNMLDFQSYKKWKNHMLVYSSFAVLLYVYLENIWGFF